MEIWGSGELYKILDPGPYCPETGHAHITCRAVVLAALGTEALVAMAVAFRLMMVAVFISEAGEKAGMASGVDRQCTTVWPTTAEEASAGQAGEMDG